MTIWSETSAASASWTDVETPDQLAYCTTDYCDDDYCYAEQDWSETSTVSTSWT